MCWYISFFLYLHAPLVCIFPQFWISWSLWVTFLHIADNNNIVTSLRTTLTMCISQIKQPSNVYKLTITKVINRAHTAHYRKHQCRRRKAERENMSSNALNEYLSWMNDDKWNDNDIVAVELLSCHDCKTGKYTRPIYRQRLGKHVPRATVRQTTMEVLLETGFSTSSMLTCCDWEV